MKFVIPYVYRVYGIRKKCRKAEEVIVKGSLRLTIKEVPRLELNVAASWLDMTQYAGSPFIRKLYFGNGQFWQRHMTSRGAGRDAVVTDLNLFISKASMPAEWDNPFGNHKNSRERDAQRNLDSVKTEKELLQDGWKILSSNNDDEREELRKVAKGYLIREGKLYVKDKLHVYHTMTFGLGRNHGVGKGTHLCISTIDEALRISCGRSIYSLNDREAAIAGAAFIAEERGDTKALPMMPDNDVEVLLPDVVALPSRIRKAA